MDKWNFYFFQSDPNSASTLQLDQLEELINEENTYNEKMVIDELKIRPKTMYKVPKIIEELQPSIKLNP